MSDKSSKLDVPDTAVALWVQVLKGRVNVPDWEVRKPDGDVRMLVELNLIKVEPGKVSPNMVLDLVDESLRLSTLQVEALRLLKGKGKIVEDFTAWADSQRIEFPLSFLKKLLDLNIVKRDVRASVQRFVSR